jgi:sulfite reductase (NADPH) flavoprotein alpha-component
MAIEIVSGYSSPVSTSTTLTAQEIDLKNILPYGTKNISASEAVEYISSRSTSTSSVYVYDLAEQTGFGTLAKRWAEVPEHRTARVHSLQTRAGAGLSLVGRLSEGSSEDVSKGTILTAYTTPTGLAAMAHSLSYLPPAAPSSRLVLQVPTVTPIGENFSLSPTLAPLSAALNLLPENVVVYSSATAQETVDLAALAYHLGHSHIVHLFDHHGAAREVGHVIREPLLRKVAAEESLKVTVEAYGYALFDYVGDANAEDVIVVVNGAFAHAASALVKHASGLGIIVVRVVRPWDEAAFQEVLPASARRLHVFDEVATETSQGVLYTDVLGTAISLPNRPTVRSHRITSGRLQSFLHDLTSFQKFVSGLSPQVVITPKSDDSQKKKLLFFSEPKSILADIAHTIEQTFHANQAISTRRLTTFDVFTKAGGIALDRIILSPSTRQDKSDRSVLTELPLEVDSQGESDFLAVLDASLLKTHSVLQYAKPGTTVLVVTSWSPAELTANLSADTLRVIHERGLRISTIDAAQISRDVVGENSVFFQTVQSVVVRLAFLRLYIGHSATESVVYRLANATFRDIPKPVDLLALTGSVWSNLVEIEFPPAEGVPVPDSNATAAPLRKFDFNALAIDTEDGDTIVNGARLGSWQDAAKHLLFPSVYSPPAPVETEEYAQNPALHPESPDRTYLVTCSVNRRLTPLEYDRNVFHLEFDTAGTGLKYEIGEALGVHGWNDEKEIIDFCSWYGADPSSLITIPVPGTDGEDGRLHTRTVFQALQQQIDIFGRPPKSFYTALAEYATSKLDRHALLFIGSPEGSSTFKKMADIDTVTFADVLALYPSARPSIEILATLVGDIKPRHYSIASAQAVVGDRVDLLVVTVEWANPSGMTLSMFAINLNS